MAEEKDKNNKGGTGSDKVEGESPKGGKAVGGLSDKMLTKIRNAMKGNRTLYLRVDDVGQNDLNYLDRAEVLNQLSREYHVDLVFLDDDGNVVSKEKSTSTAIAVRGNKNGAKTPMNPINCNETKRTPKGVAKKDEDVYPLPLDEMGNKYPTKKCQRKTWGEITKTVQDAINDHYERNGSPKKCDLATNPQIKFNNGEVDFDELNFGEVTVDVYAVSENHDADRRINFRRANELMAQKLTKEKGQIEDPEGSGNYRDYTVEDVVNYMDGNNPSGLKMTWHEKQNGKNMQKVPTLLHGNIDHSGGISMEAGRVNDRVNEYEPLVQTYGDTGNDSDGL